MGKWDKSRGLGSAPTFLSLFSGCGGLDSGFAKAGFQCEAAFDMDVEALAVHRANIPGDTFRWDLSTGTLPERNFGRPDVILSGSPCQGFSTIGKRRIDDARNTLLLAAGRIAVSLRPRVFIAENVPAVEFGAHRKYWLELAALLREAGYTCTSLHLTASDFGVAQMRRRLFLVATMDGRAIKVAASTTSPITLHDALADLVGLETSAPNHEPELLPADSVECKIAKHLRQGQKLCNVRISDRAVHTWDIPEAFGCTSERERTVLNAVLRIRRRERLREFGDADPVLRSSIKRFLGFAPEVEIESLLSKNYLRKIGKRLDLRHSFNGKYRRLEWNALSLTVDTSFGNPKNFLHPTEHRGLTVREAARIQGFPDTFKFTGSLQHQFKLVGNAVPPPVAHALAISTLGLLS
jgi:DNA (cytosine-5)-methyltransferase 1